MTTATRAKITSLENNWSRQTDAFTHNDLIDAYLQGKKVVRTEAEIAMQKLFEGNLEKARFNSENLLNNLKIIGVKVHFMHIRADSLTEFNTLIISSIDDYKSSRILEAIKSARKITNLAKSDEFSINFSFTYKSEFLNENCLESDGYFLKYNAIQ